jgi:hypothetical protein
MAGMSVSNKRALKNSGTGFSGSCTQMRGKIVPERFPAWGGPSQKQEVFSGRRISAQTKLSVCRSKEVRA